MILFFFSFLIEVVLFSTVVHFQFYLAFSGKVNSVMNTTVVKGSQVNGLKPITLSKSSLGRPLATKAKSTICSSSSSNLACNISKSPSNSLKRKVDAGTKKQPSSCSVVRTPSRIASRDKIGSSNSSLSGLVSVTKFSSSISPASSISDRSSESSSPSTSMTKVRSNSSRTIFHSSSSKKHLPGNNARHVLNSQKSHTGSCLEGKETRNAGSISQRVRGATAAEKVLTHSPEKPLGLRQPSPKIGFFEGVSVILQCNVYGCVNKLCMTKIRIKSRSLKACTIHV